MDSHIIKAMFICGIESVHNRYFEHISQACLGVTALGNLNSMTPMHFWTDQVPKSLGDPNWVDPKFKWFDFVHILSRKNSSQSYQGCIWVLWTVSDKPSSEMQMLLIIILFLPLISANSDWRNLLFFQVVGFRRWTTSMPTHWPTRSLASLREPHTSSGFSLSTLR